MSGANISCPSPAKAARPIQSKIQTLIVTGCRYVVGGVFLMAAVSKIVNLHEFESEVLLHSNLPQALAMIIPSGEIQLSFNLARIVVALLPWLELICGLCLVFHWAIREAATISSILLSLFIGHSIAYQSENCHCFFFPRAIPNLPWWWHPLRDGLFLTCSMYLVWRGLPKNAESR